MVLFSEPHEVHCTPCCKQRPEGLSNGAGDSHMPLRIVDLTGWKGPGPPHFFLSPYPGHTVLLEPPDFSHHSGPPCRAHKKNNCFPSPPAETPNLLLLHWTHVDFVVVSLAVSNDPIDMQPNGPSGCRLAEEMTRSLRGPELNKSSSPSESCCFHCRMLLRPVPAKCTTSQDAVAVWSASTGTWATTPPRLCLANPAILAFLVTSPLSMIPCLSTRSFHAQQGGLSILSLFWKNQ